VFFSRSRGPSRGGSDVKRYSSATHTARATLCRCFSVHRRARCARGVYAKRTRARPKFVGTPPCSFSRLAFSELGTTAPRENWKPDTCEGDFARFFVAVEARTFQGLRGLRRCGVQESGNSSNCPVWYRNLRYQRSIDFGSLTPDGVTELTPAGPRVQNHEPRTPGSGVPSFASAVHTRVTRRF
jgi:hypothetical protein